MQDSDNREKRVGRHAGAREENSAPDKRPENAPAAEPKAAPPQDSAARTAASARRAPKKPTAAEADEALDEYDLYGDEGDIPVLPRRKKKKPDAKKKKKAAAKKKAKRRLSVPPLFSDSKFRRKRSIFEIMSATSDDGVFKPLRIFGHKIRFWPVFALILLVMLIGVGVISNSNIKTLYEIITIVGLAEDLENYKILVISDLNGKRFGDAESSLIRQVESVKYDMILLMGDMVGSDGDPTPLYEFLDGISKPSKVYFVCGNSDPGPFVETARDITGTLEQIVLEDWILGAIERGANYVDAPMSVTVGTTSFWLSPTNYLNMDASAYMADWKAQTEQEQDGTVSGLTSDYNSLPFTSYRYAQAQKFYAAASSIASGDLLIGLSHELPSDEVILSSATHDDSGLKYLHEPDLIIAGHYCGGVWRLPLIGAFYVPNRMLPRGGWFPAEEDIRGLSTVGQTQVYITGGLSTNSDVKLMPFRLMNGPEMTLITLTATLPQNMLEAAG